MNRIGQAAEIGLAILTMSAQAASADAITVSDAAYLRSISHDPTLQYVQVDATAAKLHALINDPATAKNPAARKKVVDDFLDSAFIDWIWDQGHKSN